MEDCGRADVLDLDMLSAAFVEEDCRWCEVLDLDLVSAAMVVEEDCRRRDVLDLGMLSAAFVEEDYKRRDVLDLDLLSVVFVVENCRRWDVLDLDLLSAGFVVEDCSRWDVLDLDFSVVEDLVPSPCPSCLPNPRTSRANLQYPNSENRLGNSGARSDGGRSGSQVPFQAVERMSQCQTVRWTAFLLHNFR